MRDKKRGLPLFPILLSAYALLLMSGIVVFANVLNDKLVSYESKQVKYAAESVFNEFFGGDLERVAREYGDHPDGFEDFSHYLTALESKVDKDSLFYEKKAEENGKYYFSVADKNAEIGEYILSQTEENKWLLEDVNLFLSPKQSVTVTVQKGSEVRINGVALSEKHVLSEDYSHPSNSYAFPEENCEGIVFVTYRLDGLYVSPEVAVTDRFGSECEAVKSEENVYTFPAVYDTHRSGEVEERIKNAAEEYCRYMYRDASLTDIMIYVDRSGELYAYLKNLTEYWSDEGERRDFQNAAVTELYFHSENVFTCKVNLTAALDDDINNIELTLLFYRADRAWMLHDVLN